MGEKLHYVRDGQGSHLHFTLVRFGRFGWLARARELQLGHQRRRFKSDCSAMQPFHSKSQGKQLETNLWCLGKV